MSRTIEGPKRNNEALSEEESRLIGEIEALPAESDSDRSDLILVWRGLKPATMFSLLIVPSWNSDRLPDKSSYQKNEEILRERTRIFLGQSGLSFIEGENANINFGENRRGSKFSLSGSVTLPFYVARDMITAEKCHRLFRDQSPRSLDEEAARGELSGYPASAIEGFKKFISGDIPASDLAGKGWPELPRDVLAQDFMAFADFRLSKNWRSEIETARRWAEEIQKVDPGLYKRIVAAYKKYLHNSVPGLDSR